MSGSAPRLRWGVKASFRDYVGAIADGSEQALDGAQPAEGDFEFPLRETVDGALRFGGRIEFRGYNDLLAVTIRDPWLHPDPEEPWMSVVDPAYRGDTSHRIRLCRLSGDVDALTSTQGLGRDVTLHAHLLMDALRIFDDVYGPGAELDDLTLVAPLSQEVGSSRVAE
jgi:hypothetical protein